MKFKEHIYDGLIALIIVIGITAYYFLHVNHKSIPANQSNVQSKDESSAQVDNQAVLQESGLISTDLLKTKPTIILRLHGSNTIGGKLVPALAAAYLQSIGSDVIATKPMPKPNESLVLGFLPNINQVVGIEVKAHGSSTGFKSLIGNEADIAMSSRPIKHQENLKLIIENGDMTNAENEHIVALDGLAIVVHPENNLKSITVKQLADVFAGKITNWSQIGGKDAAINLYARDDQSGTYDTFKSLILDKYKQKLGAARRFESNAELVNEVRNDHSAIGFSGLAYARKDMIVAVSAGTGLPAIEPNHFSIGSEDYPLSRRLYLYANKFASSNPHIADFIDYSVSRKGQQLAESEQFIPQKILAKKPENLANFPKQYRQIVKNGSRLSMTFRMRADRAEIDNKSAQDIENLVSFLNSVPYEKIRLIGFSAGESNDLATDRNRALIRSKLLAYELKQRGIQNVEVTAFGEHVPVDSNEDSMGVYRNNRTEVWIFNLTESS